MAENPTVAAAGRPADERLQKQSGLRKLLSRPELGAIAGTVLVFLFFGATAHGTGMFAADGIMNWITVTAQLTIIATGAALLMVGGEFDLSVGSMIGFAGMMIAIPTVYFGWPIEISVVFAFCGALLIGFLNGLIVVRTRLPSFIVTLASLYILRGMTIALSILFANRTIVSGVKNFAGDSFVVPLFSGKAFPGLFVWMAEAGIIGTLPNGQPSVQGIPA
ncbi:MAG: ABC transporter permease, partial [Mesorhizobium sp.]